MSSMTADQKEKIAAALKAASSLIVVEQWVTPEHEFEKERRYQARLAVQKLCIEAMNELEKMSVES